MQRLYLVEHKLVRLKLNQLHNSKFPRDSQRKSNVLSSTPFIFPLLYAIACNSLVRFAHTPENDETMEYWNMGSFLHGIEKHIEIPRH